MVFSQYIQERRGTMVETDASLAMGSTAYISHLAEFFKEKHPVPSPKLQACFIETQ